MTEPPFDEHGERLRRALHAEAESVDPDPAGLEQIQAKITARRWRFPGLLASPWLRPIAAAGGAIAIAAAAVTATPAIESIVSASHQSPSSQNGTDGRTTGVAPWDPAQTGRWLPSTGPTGSEPPSVAPTQTGAPVRGNCPAGQVEVPAAHQGTPDPSSRPAVSCQPAQTPSTPPVHPTTPIVTTPPVPPTGTPSGHPVSGASP